MIDNTFCDDFLDKTLGEFWNKLVSDNNDFFITNYDVTSNQLTFEKNPTRTYISRELLFYKEKFDSLSPKLKFIQSLNSKISTVFTTDLLASENENLNQLFSDNDLLALYMQNYSRLNSVEADLIKDIKIIQNKLFEKGYFLETNYNDGKENERVKWGISFKSKFGEIYKLAKTVVNQEIEIEVNREKQVPIYGGGVSGEFHYGSGAWRDRSGRTRIANGEHDIREVGTKTIIVKEKIKTYEKVEKENVIPVEINDEPIYEKILNLKEKGYWVHVFENSNSSSYSDSGILLSEIMQDCENSDKVRVNTVIVIKDYSYVDNAKKSVIGATFYFHPVKAIIPSKLPTVGIRESLDYRMSWTGLEIGKLIDSICLAPGETKTISISNKFSTLNSSTTSNKTFNEISSVDTKENLTEFENLVTSELERSKESSSSISANASFGGYGGASGDSKQSSRETLKDFTKNLNKSSAKASNTLNKRASVEISSTSTTSVENSSSTTRNSTISNINQGKSLNLNYHQLNNRYTSRVYLDNLRLEVSSSLELIEGSGIYDKFLTKLSSIEQILALIKIFIPHFKAGDKNENLIVIIRAIIQNLNEYLDIPLSVEDGELKKLTTQNSLKIIKVQEEFVNKFSNDSNFSEILQDYKRLILSINFDELYFNEITTILDSGSYYLDSQVGVNPATESYSEKMRELESKKIAVEIENQRILNDSIKLKNSLLLSGMPYILNSKTYSKIENDVLTTFTVLDVSKQIDKNLELNVFIEESKIEGCSVEILDNQTTLLIKWNNYEYDKIKSISIISIDSTLIIN